MYPATMRMQARTHKLFSASSVTRSRWVFVSFVIAAPLFVVVSTLSSHAIACEASFKTLSADEAVLNSSVSNSTALSSSALVSSALDSSAVYVLKFDPGAGFIRVVTGRIFIVDRDSNGEAKTVEVFHDRGTGTYGTEDVFHPIAWPSHSQPRHQWRKVLGPAGFTRVQLIAADSSGHRFIARTPQGDLRYFQSHELFPLASSNR